MEAAEDAAKKALDLDSAADVRKSVEAQFFR
jgi:hypothetical protein